jgi:hypothetical protein
MTDTAAPRSHDEGGTFKRGNSHHVGSFQLLLVSIFLATTRLQPQTPTMPKGKKRATNASDDPKLKRRRVAQSEQEVEHRTLTDLPVELCNEVRTAQADW